MTPLKLLTPFPIFGVKGIKKMHKNFRLNSVKGLCILRQILFYCKKKSQSSSFHGIIGRQANKTLPDLLLKLPIDIDGNPDWQFMEDYIKSLPYGDRLEG